MGNALLLSPLVTVEDVNSSDYSEISLRGHLMDNIHSITDISSSQPTRNIVAINTFKDESLYYF